MSNKGVFNEYKWIGGIAIPLLSWIIIAGIYRLPTKAVVEGGTFIVLTLTLLFIVQYVKDTNRIANDTNRMAELDQVMFRLKWIDKYFSNFSTHIDACREHIDKRQANRNLDISFKEAIDDYFDNLIEIWLINDDRQEIKDLKEKFDELWDQSDGRIKREVQGGAGLPDLSRKTDEELDAMQKEDEVGPLDAHLRETKKTLQRMVALLAERSLEKSTRASESS